MKVKFVDVRYADSVLRYVRPTGWKWRRLLAQARKQKQKSAERFKR